MITTPDNIFRLTSLQQELWMSHESLSEKHPGISCGGKFLIKGYPDVELLSKALKLSLRSHRLLTATLRQSDQSIPFLETGVYAEPDFCFYDIRNKDDSEAVVNRIIYDFSEEKFGPVGGRLCRFALIYIDNNRSWFLSRYFHLVEDGIAALAHFHLLSSIYKMVHSNPCSEPDVAFTWNNDVTEDFNHIGSPRYYKDIEFYKNYLVDLPDQRIFTPKPGHVDKIEEVERLELKLSPESTEKIRTLVKNCGGGINRILIAIHALLISRLYDRDKISIQTPVRYGERKNVQNIIGHRVNIIPLIVDFHKIGTFKDLTAHIGALLREFSKKVRTPFQHGLRKLAKNQSDTSFIWDTNINYLPKLVEDKTASLGIMEAYPLTSKYDPVLLGIYVVEGYSEKDQLQFVFIYSKNHFSETDIRNYLKRIEKVVMQLLDNADKKINELDILTDEEMQDIGKWEKGPVQDFKINTITELFDKTAQMYPFNDALCGINGERMDYQSLMKRADSISLWLINMGVEQGKVVAVLASRHFRLPELILGIMKAGGIYLPIDPSYPFQRIKYFLEDSAAQIIIALDESFPVELQSKVIYLPERFTPGVSIRKQNVNDPAYLIYTSGSSGNPKGVLLSHAAFVNMIQGQILLFGVNSEDRVLQFASPAFDASLSEIFMALLSGASLYTINREMLDVPWTLREYMKENGISVVTLPPSYLRLFDCQEITGLKVLITAGEAPIAEDIRFYAKKYKYFNAYGPTETAVCATLTELQPGPKELPASIGRPLPNTNIHILDKNNRRVAPGVPGELCMSGPGLAIEYLNRPELTSIKFVQNPFKGIERIYKSGDIAVWLENGQIALLGRNDDQLKIRGHRIETGEIKSILEGHETVSQACICTISRSGESPELIAFIVLKKDHVLKTEDLINYLNTKLPRYMHPTRFIPISDMPLTVNGKIDKKHLEKIYTEKNTKDQFAKHTDIFDEKIKKVVKCYEAVLGENINDVDLDKSFSVLGGDSLKAIELIKILSSSAGINISLRSLMADSSPLAVATLGRNNTSDSSSTESMSKVVPLTRGQYQLWFQSLLSEYGAQYNMPLLLSISSDEQIVEKIAESFERAVECQPAYRLKVQGDNENVYFNIEDNSSFKVEKLDVRNLNNSEEIIKSIIYDFTHRKFDLRCLPLIRSIMIRTSESNWQWLIVMHHIVGDAESLSVLLESAIQYMDGKTQKKLYAQEIISFAEREERYLHGKESSADFDFLMKRLTPLPPRLNLAGTFRTPFKRGHGDTVTLLLSDELTSKIDELSNATGCSQLVIFAASVSRFLQLLCDEKDIAVAIPVGLRDNAELFDYCGYFVNTVILRIYNPASMDENVLIKECSDLFDEMLAASRYPFMMLPAALGEKRKPDRAPLIDVLVTVIDDSSISNILSGNTGIDCKILPVNLRSSKLDYTFILHIKQDGSRELVLEYDSDLANRTQAEKLLKSLSESMIDSGCKDIKSSYKKQDPETDISCNTIEIKEYVTADNLLKETEADVPEYSHEEESIQLQIADAWQKILGGIVPEQESNFFVLGGDSIKAIQICGILNRQGLKGVSPSYFFQYPVFGTFCSEVRKNRKNTQLKVKKTLPGPISKLLPMQRWLFAEHAEHWKKFFMLLPLKIIGNVDEEKVQKAFMILVQRHEAFRMSFSNGRAYLLSEAPEPYWGSSEKKECVEINSCLRDISATLFEKIDPCAGKNIAAHFLKGSIESYLLITGHHLVLDSISLQIICQDLNSLISNESQFEDDDNCGIATLLSEASVYGKNLLDENEIRFWENLICEPYGKLISLKNNNNNSDDRFADRITVSKKIAHIGSADKNDMRSNILSALSKALYLTGQKENIFIKMEGHGRSGVFPDHDLSRTVGWFTVTYPVLLKISENDREIRQWADNFFRNLKYGGASYQLALEKKGEKLVYRAQVSLNYLGEFNKSGDDEFIQIYTELLNEGKVNGLVHHEYIPDTPLELTVFKDKNQELHLQASFSPNCVDKQWVNELMVKWVMALDQEKNNPDSTMDNEILHLADVCMCKTKDIESYGPVNFAREGMLFQCELDDSAQTYSVEINFRLKGLVNTGLLEKAWLLVLTRHENLRSLFPMSSNGNYVRVVLKKCRTLVSVNNMISLPEKFQEQKREKISSEQMMKKFDLQRGPLITMNLFSYSEQDHEMSWFFHHILMDGWSAGILLDQLFKTYEALEKNIQIPPQAAPVLKICDSKMSEKSNHNSLQWWKDTLSGFKNRTFIAGCEISQDTLKTPLKEKIFTLETDSLQAIRKLADRNSVSLAHVFQVLWGFVLASENDQRNRDVVYGIVSSGRSINSENIENAVGLFVETVPLRIKWTESEKVIDLLRRVRDQAIERTNLGFLHLADIQKSSELGSALFDNILVYENYPVETISVKDSFEICEVTGREWHPYSLSMSIVPGTKYKFRFNYRDTIISDEKIDEIAEKWLELLRLTGSEENLLCSHIEQQLSVNKIVSTNQFRIADELILGFNATARPYPSDKSIGEILLNQCQRYSQKKAFIAEDGAALTYAELEKLTSSVASGLKGVKTGEPVAIAMPRGPESIIVMAAIVRAGGCYLPIDSKNPGSRIKTMLKIADCRTVISWKGGKNWFDQEDLNQITFLDYDDLINNHHESVSDVAKGGDMPAYILYTSGSSGEPKGVLVPHKAVLRLVINSDFWDLKAGERCLQAAPLGFDASTLEVWGTLLNGGTLSFISEEQLLSPGGLKQKIIKDRITMMWLTSSLCNIFADDDAEMFKPLRKLFTGGEALSPGHIKKIADACPELELYNGYGPTENTTFTTVHKISNNELDGSAIPIGRPISNTRVYIVDENNQIVAPGEWGEICAAGDGLALKYIGREDLTKKAFVQLLHAFNERVYKTGDKGRWRKDGVIEFGGRIDGQVKIRGYRIEIAEIENRINQFQGVMGCAVISLEKDNEIHLYALVKSEDKNSEKLVEYLKKHLPSYMIPEQFKFVESLPFTNNGKMDRHALKSILLKKDIASQNNAVCNDLELKIMKIFEDILERGIDSIDSDFYQLGGHSLKALKLLNRIRKEFCSDIDLRMVMENPTPSKLAKIITTKSVKNIVPEKNQNKSDENEYLPMNSAQERMWFLQKLQPESTVYTIPFAVRIKSEIELEDIKKVFSLLENRHDAFRLRMPEKMEIPLKQKLSSPGSLVVDCQDLSHTPDAENKVSDAIYKERQKPFRFGYDKPLIRVVLFKTNGKESILFINIHHIVFDGVSASVILREIQQAFKAVKTNCSPEWKDLPLRYSDYLRNLAGQNQKTEEIENRWLKRLIPVPDTLLLPYDMKRPAKQSFKGESHNFTLAPELRDKVEKLANQMHVTVFTVLLSVVKIFIYRHTSQKDFVVGIPVAGRTLPELEEMVGLLVNTIPVRCSIEPEMNFHDFVKKVSDRLLDALSDQQYPLEELIKKLELPRDEMRNPLFDILVAMEDSSWQLENKTQYLKMEKYSLPGLHSKMDMSFYFNVGENGINVSIEYSSDLFYRKTIEKMAERFTCLLQSILIGSETTLYSLNILPLAEKQMVINEYNSTCENYNTKRSIDEMFIAAVSEYGDAIALHNSMGQKISYRELDRRVDTLAGYLIDNGIKKTSHVALCFDRSFDMISSIFALMRIGAVYVPVPSTMISARMRSIIEDCRDLTVLTNNQYSSRFDGFNLKILNIDGVNEIRTIMKETVSSQEIAYLIYTSGSTGRPKGVMIRHNSVLNRIMWMQSRFPLDENDVILQKTPISFDVSIWELFWWSWTGASLALLDPSGEGNPAVITEAIYRHKVTVIHFVPSMMRIFLEYLKDHQEVVSKIKSLRYVFASGEALSPDLVEMYNKVIYNKCGCELHNLYGPTEATVDVTWYPCTGGGSLNSIPIGKPVANTQIYILDEYKKPQPVGVKGEIHIGGVQVAAGYINQPLLTSEKFIDDPFSPGNRLYRTGDLGYWNSKGEIEYSGRIDFQVKLRGFRIELGEIEQALTSIDNVSAAVVMVKSINGIDSLEAYLKMTEGATVDAENIRKTLISKLPEYMIPHTYQLINEMPLSANGKIDRRLLAEQKTDASKELPVNIRQITNCENEIMSIWKLVLPEINDSQVDKNFFELGGNSLLLIRLHELLEKKWPGVFTPADLFVATTITRQAEQIISRAGKIKGRLENEKKKSDRKDNPSSAPIAIIGMALRLSNYEQIEHFWSDLLAGADRKGPLTDNRRKEFMQIVKALSYPGDVKNITEAAFLDDISGFDNRRFAMSPSDAELLDPEQRLFLETVNRCVEDAGYGGKSLDSCNVGVFAGAVVNNSYKDAAMRSFPDRSEQIFVLNVPSNLATRISYIKNWTGPAALIDTACSSSLKAIHDASTALRNGECEVAVAGGVRILLTPIKSNKTFAIESTTGQTRSFDHLADGTGAGEGCVVFLLKPLSKAIEDGDSIRAVIKGSAVNQDGRSSSIAAPNPVAQSMVIRAAGEDAGIDLDSIDFFEAHGTGTVLGDPIEVDGLTRAFNGKYTKKKYISSVKGNFGHLDAAAGAIGIAKAVCALQHSIIPGQVHFEKPNPKIDFEHAPVQVADRNINLEDTGRPLRCGVSAFGLSGINTHIILEKASLRHIPPDDGSWMVIVLSADTIPALNKYAEEIVRCCLINKDWPLHAITATLVMGRDSLKERVAFYARSREEFLNKLLSWCIEPKRGLPGLNKSEKMSKCLVAGIKSIQEAERVCDELMKGAKPCWPEDVPVYRVNLPSVPLNRTTHWAKFSSAETVYTEKFLGDMILSTQNIIFPVNVHKDVFWPVYEHRINDQATMVGMCFPALLGEISKEIMDSSDSNPKMIEIEGVSWLSILQPGLLEEHSVQIELTENDCNYKVTLQGLNRIDGWQEFAKATMTIVPLEDKKMDLELIRKGLKPAEEKTLNEKAGENQQVKVSRRWDCRKQVLYSEDRRHILASLELDSEYSDDLNTIDLHPAMLDVAVSLALDKPGLIPVSCREMKLYKHHGIKCYSYVVIDDIKDETGKSLKATCMILDQDGTVIAEFIDMFFLQAAAPTPRIHRMSWCKTEVETVRRLENRIEKIMILEDSSFDTLIIEDKKDMTSNITRVKRPVQEEEWVHISDLIHDEKSQVLIYIIPLSGFNIWELAGFMKKIISKGLREKLKMLIIGKGAAALPENPAYSSDSNPDTSTVPAMMLSLSKEEPKISFRYLEISDKVTLNMICNEIELIQSENTKIYINRYGERFEPKIEPVISTENKIETTDKFCTVISGGLGAMALTLAETMSELGGGGAVALLHRGVFPPQEQWNDLISSDDSTLSFRICKLLELKAKGLKYRIYQCDITDENNLRACLNKIREELGPVGAVLHAAGVPGDGFLIGKSKQKFESVLAPKITGVNNLHKFTLNDKIRYFILASSRTGITGAAGQTDYAAANAYLDAFAHWRVSHGLSAVSIDWNSWKNIGMAARSAVTDSSMPGLLPEQASNVLKKALMSGEAQVVISMFGENLSGKAIKEKSIPESRTDEKRKQDDLLMTLPFQDRIMKIITEGLGYKSELSVDDDFYSMGGDSITGMHIVNHINRMEKLDLSLSDLFSNSRLGSFIDAIKQMQNEKSDKPVKKSVTPELDEYPVSWEQLAVLQAETNLSPVTGYNLPQFITLPEDCDLDRMKQAFKKLISIHEVLRTKFDKISSEKPVMKIISEFDFILEVIQIETLDKRTIERLVRPFKLDELPLFRSAILVTVDEGMVLFFDIHHSLADAKSIVILLNQLLRLYNGENVETTSLQQKDAAWLQQNNKTDEEEAEEYWLGQYKDSIPFIDLPSDFIRPVHHTFKAGSFGFNVPLELVHGIRSIARQNSTTSYNFILSVWSILLARYASSDDLVIAVAVDGRDNEDLKNSTGMFVSLIPMRLQIDESSNFKEFLEKNQKLNTDAFRYRSYSLNRLLSKLKIPASPDRTVLSEITFSYMNFESPDPVNSHFKALKIPNPSTKADLAIFVTDNPQQISFSIEYYADLFTEKRIQRMSHHFLNLLQQIVQKEGKLPLRSCSLLENEEKAKIEGFKSGPSMRFVDRSIDSLVWINAARQGDSVLWKNPDGSMLTWKELDRRSTVTAEKFRETGVKAGEGVYIENSDYSDLPLLILSIIRSGAFGVISIGNKRENEVKWIISDTDEKTYIGNAAVLNRKYVLNHNNTEKKIIQFDICPENTAIRILDSNENSIDINQLTLHCLAGQFQECGISQGKSVLLTENPFSLFGQIQLWASILAGGKIAEIHNGYLSNPFQSLNKLSNMRADVLIAESSGLTRADRKNAEVLSRFKRMILIGDEVPDYHLLKSWAQLCPDLKIVTALRIPGTVFLMSISEFKDEYRNFLRAGRPMACNQISIIDNIGVETPIGVWGNISLNGLVNEITSCTEGVAAKNPWRRTNIVARWGDDGNIELRGLLQDSDDYSALLRSSILEKECVNKVELKKNSSGEWCASVIADSSFDPVQTKKIIRKMLPVQSPNFYLEIEKREMIGENRNDEIKDTVKEKALTETEKRVVQIFKEYFRKENICVDDSFFSLGGHSLLGMQIINQLSVEYCKELSIRDLYHNPSPAELAALLEKNSRDALTIIKSEADKTGLYPLSHAQQRLYVQHYSEGGSVAYNFTFAFRIDGELDKKRLSEALNRLCDRHEILRTAFVEKEGQVWQFIVNMDEFSANFLYHDIFQLTMDDALRLFSEDAVKPFSLDKPGLFMVRCCKIEENLHLLALTMHHIIADGWSMQLFFREMMELYVGGKDTVLSPLNISYRDYSLWQQNRNWDEEAAYWKNELHGAKQGINLPADKISNGLIHNLGIIQKVLPGDLMDRIREMSRKKAVSPATLILSVFASFLYRLTRQEDMVIGMGVAGREKKELEGLIGFFVNILPMRIKVNDETDFEDLIDSVHRSLVEAVSRQDFPYDLLIRNISVDRKNTREALVNVMFEYQRYGDLSLGADINIPELPFSVSPIYLHEHTGIEDASPAQAKYDLTLFIQDMQPNCIMRAEFDASVFNRKSVESWLIYIEKFLNGITEA